MSWSIVLRTSGAMSKRAWLTPDDAPDTLKCWRVFCPEGDVYEAALRGALLSLAEETNWEQFGTQTPEDVATAFLDAFFQTIEMNECV